MGTKPLNPWKLIFAPDCISRGSLAVKMPPDFGVPKIRFGRAQFAVLSTLEISLVLVSTCRTTPEEWHVGWAMSCCDEFTCTSQRGYHRRLQSSRDVSLPCEDTHEAVPIDPFTMASLVVNARKTLLRRSHMNGTDFRNALIAIQVEYVEMPGLKLTMAQVTRLCSLPADVCQTALGALVVTGFLIETREGRYERRGTPPVRVEPLDSLTWVVAPAAA